MVVIGNVVMMNVSDIIIIIYVSFFLILVFVGIYVFMVVKDVCWCIEFCFILWIFLMILILKMLVFRKGRMKYIVKLM